MKVNEDQFCEEITLLWWRHALGGRSTVCCVQYLTIPFVVMNSWYICSLWKVRRNKMTYLWACLVQFLLQSVKASKSELSCLACFITHTPSCFSPYCDWPLSRERRVTYNGRLTGVWCVTFLFLVTRRFSSPSPSSHDSSQPPWQPALRPQVFKRSTMLQVFCSWLESMRLGTEPKPQWATQHYGSNSYLRLAWAWKGLRLRFCASVCR